MDSVVGTPNEGEVHWPVKVRELQNHHTDTTLWNDFKFRDDDIIISTWAKSGTTWMQQIISQLLHQGADEASARDESHWLDLRAVPVKPALDAQTHRRYIKTHSPIDALVYSPKAKYVFVARDVRDTMWSMHNHLYSATTTYYELINDTPGRVGPALKRPPPDPVQYFREFLEDDTDPTKSHSPFWEHFRGWWNARSLPNLLLVHFNDLKTDLEGEIRRVAHFLEIEIPEEKWPDVVHHCTFKYMKENEARLSPEYAEVIFTSNALINKGDNGRWTNLLTKEDIDRFENKAKMELGEEAADWLAGGTRYIAAKSQSLDNRNAA
ncbi:P-loop containing nucleoside triphosphate hydrolase protein [Hortaea werneckii]|nr:P-loop containing nucleoside triphosphate hydrolase protein [Hortaea werneckii]